jgi:hypothetical protein
MRNYLSRRHKEMTQIDTDLSVNAAGQANYRSNFGRDIFRPDGRSHTMALGKSASRTCFQIALKGVGFLLLWKGAVEIHLHS